MSACFHDPLWLRQPTFCPHPCDFRFGEGVKTKRGKGRRDREEGDGRLQEHGERTKCSFVVALHTGNFINCAFCYADACRPSQPPSPLSPSSFLFPHFSFLFPLSSSVFDRRSLRLVCPGSLKDYFLSLCLFLKFVAFNSVKVISLSHLGVRKTFKFRLAGLSWLLARCKREINLSGWNNKFWLLSIEPAG